MLTTFLVLGDTTTKTKSLIMSDVCRYSKTKADCLDFTNNYGDCGWCTITSNITSVEKCTEVANYCDDVSMCAEFIFPDTTPDCSEVQRDVAVRMLLWWLAAVLINRFCINGAAQEVNTNCFEKMFVILGIALCAASLGTTIWSIAEPSNEEASNVSSALLISALLYPIEYFVFALVVFAFWKLVHRAYKFGKTPIGKYCSVSLILFVFMGFLLLLILSIVQAVGYLHWVNAITFTSLLIFGYDIAKKAIQIQTPEAEQLIMNKSHIIFKTSNQIQDDSRSEEKYPERVSESEDIHCLVWELVVFICYIGTCVSLAFVYEEYEPCFMNIATVPIAIYDIWHWAKHQGPSLFFKIVMIMVALTMISFCIVSCDCNEECLWSHIVVVVLAFVWALLELFVTQLCKRK